MCNNTLILLALETYQKFTSDGVLVLDMDGIIQYANPSVNSLFELEKGENIIGMQMNDMLSHICDQTLNLHTKPNEIQLEIKNQNTKFLDLSIQSLEREKIKEGFLCVVRDGSDLRQSEHEDSRRKWKELEQVRKLQEATEVVLSSLELRKVLASILDQLERVVPFDSSALMLLEGESLRIVAAKGLPDNDTEIGKTYPRNAMIHGEPNTPIILADAQKDPRFKKYAGTDYVRGWMNIPMCSRGQVIGYLTVDSRKANAYSVELSLIAKSFADHAAIAIDNARLFEEVQTRSVTDELTKLYNRRYFFEIGTKKFQKAKDKGIPLSIILFDIDHFKRVNDLHGHLIGDQVLQEISKRSLSKFRKNDVVARYGGEEFVALLPETDLDAVYKVAERLLKSIAESPIETTNEEVPITISIGIAVLEGHMSDFTEFIQRADEALYYAKNAGRNCIKICN